MNWPKIILATFRTFSTSIAYEFYYVNQEILDPTSTVALTPENGNCCNNSQLETESLEPIFADVPSVSHKYTTRMKDFCIIDIDIDFGNSVDVTSSR